MTPEEYRNEAFRIYEEDMEKGAELFEKAAAQKDIPSAVALSAYYYDEECDESSAKDWLEKAFEWFEQAGRPAGLRNSRSTSPSAIMSSA